MRYFFFNKSATQVLELQADEIRDTGDRLILRLGGQTVGELSRTDFAGFVTKDALPIIHSPLPDEHLDRDE